MSHGKESRKSAKGKFQDMNWKDFVDPLYIAKPK